MNETFVLEAIVKSKQSLGQLSDLARGLFIIATFILPWIGLAALPPLQFGIWVDSEPIFVALLGVTALMTLGTLANQTRVSYLVTYPGVFLTLTLVILSILFLPFIPNPDLSWFSLPQIGQGIVGYLAFTMMIISFCILIEQKLSLYLLSNITLAGIVMTSLTLMGNPNHGIEVMKGWAPHLFTSYVAFIGIPLIAGCVLLNNFILRLLLFFLGSSLVFLSFNKTASLALILSAIGVLAAYKLGLFSGTKLNRCFWASLIFAAPIATTVMQGFLATSGLFHSLSSRAQLLQMIGYEIYEHPLILLIGRGWGSYTDVLLANLTRLPVSLFQDGHWNPTWDALHRLDFHSHNQAGEALLSTGILGALLILVLPCTPILFCRKRALPWAVLTFSILSVTQATWFELPSTLPFTAFAYAAFIRCNSNPMRRSVTCLPIRTNRLWGTSLFLLVIAGTLAVTAVDRLKLGFATNQAPTSWISGWNHSAERKDLASYTGAGGIHLASKLSFFQGQLLILPSLYPVIAMELEKLLAATANVFYPSLTLRIVTLQLYSTLIQSISLHEPLHQRALIEWPKLLRQTLDDAPARSDLLVPYFTWAMTHGKETEVKEWVTDLLKRNSKDPVALWFQGSLLLSDPKQYQQGLEALQQSIKGGIGRFTPLDPVFLEKVKGLTIHQLYPIGSKA